ncbi:MAG: kinase/pyrophosphorylase [Alphaproteobacteria bacterium]|nr:MAG: kinase/pyrophosphorylase [Alphaproteobacteria bacterium]
MTKFHLHLISDSTGETIDAVAKASLAQFEGAEPIKHLWPLIRNVRQLEPVLAEIEEKRGLVMFTLVNEEIRQTLLSRLRELNVPHIAVLDPVIRELGLYLGEKSKAKPGEQHALTEEYFRRIDAMSYTMAHDDGQLVDNISKADVVLVGVSRTSKTPTSIYLANRGIKAANVPIVKGCPLPDVLFRKGGPLIIGLTTRPELLVQIRHSRLKAMNEQKPSNYVDPEAVQEELTYARRLFSRNGWPVIDVSRKSIEETAAAVIALLNRRREQEEEGTLFA